MSDDHIGWPKRAENPEVQKLTASLLTRKFSQTAQAVATSPGAATPPHFPVSGAQKNREMAEADTGGTARNETREIG